MRIPQKCTSKLQWGITSHWSEWSSSKNLQTINAGEGVEKRECSCTVDGNVNWYSHYGRRYGDSLKKLGIKPPYDPAIPLLGTYPEETKIESDTCIPLFTAALFTIARTWKQSSCSSIDGWIKKLWYIYTVEYYSAIKRNAFESTLMRWMNLEPIIQNEVSQKEKDEYDILTNAYIQNLEKWYWRIYLQGNNGETGIENRLMNMERGEERVSRIERIIWMLLLLYVK